MAQSVPAANASVKRQANRLARLSKSLEPALPIGRFERLLWGLASIAVIAVAWTMVARSGAFIAYAMPTPLQVLRAFYELVISGDLPGHLGASLGRLIAGAVLGIVSGVVIGVLAGANQVVAKMTEPLVTFFNALGGIVWIPLAILWFGVGIEAILFVIWNSVFFQVLFNTFSGVRQVPGVYRDAILTMGGSSWTVFKQVLIPGALPSIFTGVRVGFSFGWRTLIAAEMIGAVTGIGVFILDASHFFRSDQILAGILVIGAVWLMMDRLFLQPLERITIGRWGVGARR